MTEIPEHLLKRSRERRAALGLPTEGGEDHRVVRGGEAEGAGAGAPATGPPARRPRPPFGRPPQPVAPPPKPDPPYVQAAKRRRKIPIWAMPVLPCCPVGVHVRPGHAAPDEEARRPARRGQAGLRPVLVVPRHRRRGRRRLPVRERVRPAHVPDARGAGRLRRIGQPGLRRQALRRPEPARRPAHRPRPQRHRDAVVQGHADLTGRGRGRRVPRAVHARRRATRRARSSPTGAHRTRPSTWRPRPPGEPATARPIWASSAHQGSTADRRR